MKELYDHWFELWKEKENCFRNFLEALTFPSISMTLQDVSGCNGMNWDVSGCNGI